MTEGILTPNINVKTNHLHLWDWKALRCTRCGLKPPVAPRPWKMKAGNQSPLCCAECGALYRTGTLAENFLAVKIHQRRHASNNPF